MNPIFGNRSARRAAEQEARRAARRDRRRRRSAIATGAALVASSTIVGLATPAAASTDGVVVNTLDDPASDDIHTGDDIVSLREAISNARIDFGSTGTLEPITFDSSVTGTIQLTSTIFIGDVDIQGPGADVLTVRAPAYDGDDGSAYDDQGVFVLSDSDPHGSTLSVSGLALEADYYSVISVENVDLTLTGVEITGGSSFRGGGIYAIGTGALVIEDSTITGNTADNRGGGVYAGPDQTIAVTGSEISDNYAQSSGGGIFSKGDVAVSDSTIADNRAGLGSGSGGGIALVASGDAAPTLEITDESTVTGNAAREGGGGIYAATDGDILIEDSSISSNHASRFTPISPDTLAANAKGGGIRLLGDAELTIRNSDIDDNDNASRGAGVDGAGGDEGGTLIIEGASSVSGNTATGNGGGVYFSTDSGTVTVSDSTVDGNAAGDSGGGVMVRGAASSSTITGSTITSNIANGFAGGGVYAEGALTIDETTIAGNAAGEDDSFGGGVKHSSADALMVTASTVSGNSAGAGGGIMTETHDGLIVNSTISGNHATYAGDDYYGGGGLRVIGGTVEIVSSTITANTAVESGDGIFTFGYDDPSTLTLTSSIVAGNGEVDLDMLDGDGTNVGTATASNSLIGTSNVDVDDDGGLLEGDDPELGALADNGGPTLTHLPQGGSPVIDAGGPSELESDQRGFTPRVVGDASDMGAVEVGAAAPVTTTTTTSTTTTTVPPTTTTTRTTATTRRSTTTTTTAPATTTTTRPDPVVVQRPVGTQGVSVVDIETSAGPVTIAVRGATPGSQLTVSVTEVAVEDADVDTSGFEVDGKLYEVEITGSETGGATVCFPYSGTGSPTIVHWRDDGTREVLNTSVVFGTACADTKSFSPFAVVYLATDRVAGADAAETAAAVSAATFDPDVSVVYVAARAGVSDAVTAGAAGAPLLLVQRDAVPAATSTELARLDAGRVVVVGGTDAVSDAVVAQLGATRIGGADRYQTAAAVAMDRFPSGAPVVYVANGSSTPDALVAAAAAARDEGAVLLVHRDAVPAASAMALAALGADRVVVVGGTAVVSDALVSSLGATRVGGANRYETAAALAGDAREVVVVRGDDPVDAVVGAALGLPLLLVLPASVPQATEDALDRLSPRTVHVLGGTAAISAQTEADVAAFMAE